MAAISDLQLYRWQIPYRLPLTLKSGPLSARTGFFVRADSDGQELVAEVAPLSGFSRDTEKTLLKAWPELRDYFIQTDSEDWRPLDQLPSLDFAMGCIRHQLISPWQGSLCVPVNILLPTTLEHCLEAAKAWLEKGFTVFKFKLHPQQLEAGAKILRDIAALDGDIRLRLDGNRQLSPGKGRFLAKQLKGLPLDYIEEPLCAPVQLNQWATKYNLPIGLDETLDNLDITQLSCANEVTTLVIKPTLYGGWQRSVELSTAAKQHSFNVVMSSGFNSSLGLYHVGRFAQLVGVGESHHGLGTVAWHASEPLTHVGRLENGNIEFDDLPQVDWDACELMNA